jgi:hypothetical protein
MKSRLAFFFLILEERAQQPELFLFVVGNELFQADFKYTLNIFIRDFNKIQTSLIT